MPEFKSVTALLTYAQEHKLKDLKFHRVGNVYVLESYTQDEIEDAAAQIYNLTLYLNFIEHNLPRVFCILQNNFSGMPGYSSKILEDRK